MPTPARTKTNLALAFSDAYRIALSWASGISDNDRARYILATAGTTMLARFNRSAVKNNDAKERAAHSVISASYGDFLKARDIILSRTGKTGKKIPTLEHP